MMLDTFRITRVRHQVLRVLPVVMGPLLLVGALVASAAVLGPGPTLAQGMTRAEIETIVHDYLLKHPEVIVESVQTLQSRTEAELSAARADALDTHRQRLLEDPRVPPAGNPAGDVAIVEFFDYQCGYCKRVREDLLTLIDQDRKVRLVLKEFPVLGPASEVAARAALAARRQSKYWEFHNALMGHRGRLNDGAIQTLAKSLGLDAGRLQRDMDDPEIEAILTDNRALGSALQLTGTPAFVIGEQVVPGAVSLDTLKDLVSQARRKRS